jgi:hypothetical protein
MYTDAGPNGCGYLRPSAGAGTLICGALAGSLVAALAAPTKRVNAAAAAISLGVRCLVFI